MIDIKAIRAAAAVATPIYTDLLGDRYFGGDYSTVTLTKAQDNFIATANPATVLALCDEIERLRKENEKLLEIFKVKHHAALRFFEKEAAFEAEIERLRKDAARYRWIRHGDNDEIVMKGDCRGVYLPRNERLDAAIDAAMDAEA